MLRLYLHSKRAYQQLIASNIVRMPSVSTMAAYKNHSQSGSGWLLSNLEGCAKNFNASHNGVPTSCILSYDAMSISQGIVYNLSTGKMMGFMDNDLAAERAELGNFLSDDDLGDLKHAGGVAKQALQINLSSLHCPFQYPVAYFLTNGYTGIRLGHIMRKGFRLLRMFGFWVLATVGDGASENRTWQQLVSRHELLDLFLKA